MMSSNIELSDEELRRRGIEALEQALGPVDTIRFLQGFSLGRGDYTKERAMVLDLELNEIAREIEKRRVLEKAEDSL